MLTEMGGGWWGGWNGDWEWMKKLVCCVCVGEEIDSDCFCVCEKKRINFGCVVEKECFWRKEKRKKKENGCSVGGIVVLLFFLVSLYLGKKKRRGNNIQYFPLFLPFLFFVCILSVWQRKKKEGKEEKIGCCCRSFFLMENMSDVCWRLFLEDCGLCFFWVIGKK